jgi:phage-related protein
MAFRVFYPPVPPSPGTADKPEVKLFKADFGDGYTQATPAGLNHIRRVLSLRWDMLIPDDCQTILDFLEDHAGCTPFYYAPSDEADPIKWTCEDWSDARLNNGLRSLTATLKQSFTLEA